MLKFIILLTAIVGFVVPSYAQVEIVDSIPTVDSLALDSASVFSGPDSLAGDSSAAVDKFRLSTDSVYSTPLPSQVDDAGFLSSKVEYTATDSIVGSLSIGEAYLYNEAKVSYENMTITAGYIQINFDNSEVYATGLRDTSGAVVQKPIFTEGGKSYRADTMRYNFDSKKAKIKRVITKEGEGFLHGEDVKKIDDNVFYIKNASYTTCSHEHPHFEIRTRKAKVIPGDKIITRFAYLSVLDVPTPLIVPFGFFPTTETRKSGIIIPQYGRNLNRGYFLTNGGYYWAINDYLDLTVTGDAYSQGGYGVSGRTSYKKRYKFSGNFGVNYSKIKYGRVEYAEYGSQFFADNSQFAVNWSHQQDPKANPNLRFSANVNLSSSNYYQLNSKDRDKVLQNTANSSISLNKTWDGKPYNLTATVNHTQNNATNDMTVTLPDVTFFVNRQFPFKRKTAVGKKKWYEEIGYSYNATGKNEIRTKMGKPFFTETVFADSARNGIKHSIPISANYKVFNNFVLNPSINYTERWYFERSVWGFVDSANGKFVNQARVIDTARGFYGVRDFNVNTNLSTKLYGQWNYKGYLKAIRHVMTPTVGFTYRPDFSTDFWGYYQDVQIDTLGNTDKKNMYNYGLYGSAGEGVTGSVNFQLLNTLESKIRDKRDSTGSKKVKLLEALSLSTSYNIAGTEFKWSPLNLQVRSSILQGLISMTYNSTFDFYGYDEVEKKRVNKFAIDVNNKLLRTTQQRFTAGLNLDQSRLKSKKSKSKEKDQSPNQQENKGFANDLGITSGDINYYNTRQRVDFSLPWSVNVNYNLQKNYNGLDAVIRQSADMNANFELTQNWRVGMSTGYDIQAKDFTYTSFDFYRNLHCWEIRCSWVPFGLQQSYTIGINVKAQTLKDLKLERVRGIGDFTR